MEIRHNVLPTFDIRVASHAPSPEWISGSSASGNTKTSNRSSRGRKMTFSSRKSPSPFPHLDGGGMVVVWWAPEKLNSNQSGRKFHFSFSHSPAAAAPAPTSTASSFSVYDPSCFIPRPLPLHLLPSDLSTSAGEHLSVTNSCELQRNPSESFSILYYYIRTPHSNATGWVGASVDWRFSPMLIIISEPDQSTWPWECNHLGIYLRIICLQINFVMDSAKYLFL